MWNFQRYVCLGVYEPTAVLYFPGTIRVTLISLFALNYMTHINPQVLGEVAHFLTSYAAVSL